MKISELVGIGDNGYRKSSRSRIEAGQAGSIQGNRSFFHRHIPQGGIVTNIYKPRTVLIHNPLNRTYLVHMSLYNVSIKSSICRHASLQVYLFAYFPRG